MLWDDLEGWGAGGDRREVLEGGDIYTHIAGLLCCTTETNTTLANIYTPIKQNNIINWIPRLQMQVIVVLSSLLLLLFSR